MRWKNSFDARIANTGQRYQNIVKAVSIYSFRTKSVHVNAKMDGIHGVQQMIGSVQTVNARKKGEVKMLAEAIVLIPKSAKKGTEIQMDVLPLVLCKDCIHKNELNHCPHNNDIWVADDFFCADGERKNEDAWHGTT